MRKSTFYQRCLEWVCEKFEEDTSKMLIATGTLGWILSSAAQLGAIAGNPKITPEKKSFLLPQEFMDACVNVFGFFVITMLTKVGIKKMATTGKIAPQSVRELLNKNYKDKVGKLDFNLDDVLAQKPEYAKEFESYKSYKNFVTTMGTIGASVLSCNIITPLIRNKTASRVQKSYIDMKNNPNAYQTQNSGSLKI